MDIERRTYECIGRSEQGYEMRDLQQKYEILLDFDAVDRLRSETDARPPHPYTFRLDLEVRGGGILITSTLSYVPISAAGLGTPKYMILDDEPDQPD